MSRHQHSRRSGYTLLELIVVMAVITILATLSVPSLRTMGSSYKVGAAADAVRAAWAQARAHAIEEGRPYRFAVVPGSGHFRVAPDQEADWSGREGSGYTLQETLPPAVSFSVGGEGSAPPAAGSQPSPPPPASAYSHPIVFLPDGTARADAEVVFQMRGAKPVVLSLRAMTGAVTTRAAPLTGGR